jgi:lipopolysaccharide/colanic/teichoic acid biosynthesis glycosyltransferase
MEHEVAHKAEANLNQRFTSLGPFLRRWKLDELPQLLNVLLGDMSLVGPRPKLAEHQLGTLQCRPGITGAATLIFANEEAVLRRIPEHELPEFFRTIVLPAKLRLDREYMGQATFASDVNLVVRTLVRRWDRQAIFGLLGIPRSGPAVTFASIASSVDLEFAMEEGSAGD